MGETQNTTVTGAAKMTLLCHNKRLDEKYKGKKYVELPACDQHAIDCAYDDLLKEIRAVQVKDAAGK